MEDRDTLLVRTCSIVSLFSIALNPAVAGEGRTIFVSANAEGLQDGSGWGDAYTDLQVAIAAALPGDAIWVAAGSYKPGVTRGLSFLLRDGVAVFGGFAGDEDPASVDLAARDFSANETILDGLLTGGGRSYHVVSAIDVDDSAVLDGFTITGGRADGVTVNKQDVGGGALVRDASPMFRRCRFVLNEAGTRGGAVHVDSGNPTFVHCTFVSNRTTVTQGENNVGGAFFATGSTFVFARPTLVNCLFVGNSAGVGNGGSGGAVYTTPSTLLTVVNCSVAHNFADTEAGGIFGSPTVVGSVIWGNFDRRGRGRSSQISGSAVVSYSCVEGGWNGVGNTAEDPRFADASGLDQSLGTADDNLRPLAGSPCIDAGNNQSLIASLSTDLDGAPRFVDDPVTDDRGIAGVFDAVVDMGAFEYQATCDAADDCNDGFHCNGVESCDAGRCVAGAGVDCDDGVACTVDSCDENGSSCIHTSVDALCDNGFFCDGVEICDALRGCLAGSAILCSDAFDCTTDRCDEDVDACVFEPSDESCDNGDACDGVERCIIGQGCVSTGAIDCADAVGCTLDSCDPVSGACLFEPVDSFCDDGVFCNGSETCGTDGCMSGEPPCGTATFCDEMLDQCVACLTAEHCDDQDPCTADACEGSACAHTEVPDCCRTGGDCAASGPCAIAVCEGNLCGEQPAEDGSPCPDGLFCNGEEVCLSGECLSGSSPCTGTCNESTRSCASPPECVTDGDCDDGNGCTDDVCRSGSCIAVVNSAPCDDGDDCTSGDGCNAGTCAGEAIPGCGDSTPPPDPPADTDGDGVTDIDDDCPNTPAGDAVDQNGCSVDPPSGQTVVDENGNPDPTPDPSSGRNTNRSSISTLKSDRPPTDPNAVPTADPASGDGEAGQSVPQDDLALNGELIDMIDQTAANRAACGACGAVGFITTILLGFGLVLTRLLARRGVSTGRARLGKPVVLAVTKH